MTTSAVAPVKKERTGECLAFRCKTACQKFVYERYIGTYATCLCGHTQPIHQRAT